MKSSRELTDSTTGPQGSHALTRRHSSHDTRGRQGLECGGAALVGTGGRELPLVGVWQEPTAVQSHVVMVEAAALPEGAQGTFTLKRWEHGGARPITIQGITFPRLPP